MNRRSWVLGVVALAVALPCAASAQAPALTPWVGIDAGWAAQSMSDVNTEIGAMNTVLAPSGMSLSDVGSGLMLGARVGVTTSGGFMFGVGYERLFASTQVGNLATSLSYRLPANAILGTFGYRFAPQFGRLQARVGADVGYLGIAKEGFLGYEGAAAELEFIGAAQEVRLEGSGALIEPWVGGDVALSPNFSFSGSLGYRFARISDVKEVPVRSVNPPSTPIYNADGSGYSVDYSGLAIRLGITLAVSR